MVVELIIRRCSLSHAYIPGRVCWDSSSSSGGGGGRRSQRGSIPKLQHRKPGGGVCRVLCCSSHE